MEAEFFELAREAVVALRQPSWSWVDVAQIAVSTGGLVAILLGLARMKEAGRRRDREIDELGKGLRQQGQALERQGEMMTEALQGLRQQGQVLAELLQRGT